MENLKTKSSSVKSMVEGNVMYLLLAFSLPIFIGNLFQQLYNVVDTVVIGHFLGDEALAAVGSTSAIYSLLIGFTYGLSNGFSVVLARLFGADDEDSIHRAVGMSALISVVFAAFLTGASLLFMRPLLVALKTPDSIIGMSQEYLIIIMGMYIFNIGNYKSMNKIYDELIKSNIEKFVQDYERLSRQIFVDDNGKIISPGEFGTYRERPACARYAISTPASP